MKTTIEFSDELLRQIERLRAREGVTMRALIEEGLRLAIAAREREGEFRLDLPIVGGPPQSAQIDLNALIRESNADWSMQAPPLLPLETAKEPASRTARKK
jgi:hypothetical protein